MACVICTFWRHITVCGTERCLRTADGGRVASIYQKCRATISGVAGELAMTRVLSTNCSAGSRLARDETHEMTLGLTFRNRRRVDEVGNGRRHGPGRKTPVRGEAVVRGGGEVNVGRSGRRADVHA